MDFLDILKGAMETDLPHEKKAEDQDVQPVKIDENISSLVSELKKFAEDLSKSAGDSADNTEETSEDEEVTKEDSTEDTDDPSEESNEEPSEKEKTAEELEVTPEQIKEVLIEKILSSEDLSTKVAGEIELLEKEAASLQEAIKAAKKLGKRGYGAAAKAAKKMKEKVTGKPTMSKRIKLRVKKMMGGK